MASVKKSSVTSMPLEASCCKDKNYSDKMGECMSDKEKCCGGGGCVMGGGMGCGHSHCGGKFGKTLIKTLFGILLVYLVLYVGTLINLNIKKYTFVGQADTMERTITVTGYGKATGQNDIAVTSIGYSNVDADVLKAQTDNKKVMDAVMSDLTKLGVADKDLQTNYSIYPEYNYTQDKGQEFKGYRVNNQITIKIRDLSKIPSVLALPGKYGATTVSGLNFTVDDTNNLKTLARNKALVDAKERALSLANALGVVVTAVVSYNEYETGNNYPLPVMMDSKVLGLGAGGPSAAPEVVAGGSQDVNMQVNVTYKIMPKW